jgi:hypothetical protein
MRTSHLFAVDRRMVDENLGALKREFLSELPRSMLVLQGENSPHAFQMVNAVFRRCARNAQLETINDAGTFFK